MKAKNVIIGTRVIIKPGTTFEDLDDSVGWEYDWTHIIDDSVEGTIIASEQDNEVFVDFCGTRVFVPVKYLKRVETIESPTDVIDRVAREAKTNTVKHIIRDFNHNDLKKSLFEATRPFDGADAWRTTVNADLLEALAKIAEYIAHNQ